MSQENSYLQWVKALSHNDCDGKRSVCPNCKHIGLNYQYIGYEGNEHGCKIIWCESCKNGVRLSRVKIPEGEKVLINDDETDAFILKHDYIKYIWQ